MIGRKSSSKNLEKNELIRIVYLKFLYFLIVHFKKIFHSCYYPILFYQSNIQVLLFHFLYS